MTKTKYFSNLEIYTFIYDSFFYINKISNLFIKKKYFIQIHQHYRQIHQGMGQIHKHIRKTHQGMGEIHKHIRKNHPRL